MTKDRRTNGLIPSIVIAAVSLGVLAGVWRLTWPAAQGGILPAHGLAGLCLTWSLLGWALTRRAQKHSSILESSPAAQVPQVVPNSPPAQPFPAGDIQSKSVTDLPGSDQEDGQLVPSPVSQDWIAVLRIAAVTLGLALVIPMLYQAVAATILRLLGMFEMVFGYGLGVGPKPGFYIWPGGAADLALLASAILLGRAQSGDRRLITVLFWLVVFAGLWVTLQVPPFHVEATEEGVTRAVATRWSAVFMVWSAAGIGLFTLAGGYIEHRRRLLAWPHELWKLTSPLPAWPGFRYSAGMVAVVVLVLGCVHVTIWWTAPAAFIAGASMLALAKRRWEENLADVGLALITLGVVSLVTAWRPDSFPEIFNRVLIGLGIMIAFWHWLADVWTQQLDQGQAWTTSGRLIRTARRVGFLLAATAVLVSINLAAWPLLPHADADHSTWRWMLGLLGHALLLVALVFATLRTDKQTLGWMTLLALVSTIVFVMTRIRGTPFALWWAAHWPVTLTGRAAAALVLADLIRRTQRWMPYWEALYLSGVLVLPTIAICGVVLVEQLLLPRWMPAATFSGLAGVYFLAAFLPGARGEASAGAICAAVGVYMM